MPAIEVQADGPLMRGYLTAFSTKLAMALFRANIRGEPCPIAARSI